MNRFNVKKNENPGKSEKQDKQDNKEKKGDKPVRSGDAQ